MRTGGENRSRLLLIILIVTSLFLITLDLRGVKILDGAKSASQTLLSPFQRAGSSAASPIKNFFSDISRLGRTRSQINALKAENERLRFRLNLNSNAKSELNQLKSVLDLAGKAGYRTVSARVISQGSSTSYSQTITIDAGTNNGISANMTVLAGRGLVGVVKKATANSSLVQLVTDPSFRIGGRIAGSQEIGIVSGEGTRVGLIQLLDNQSYVKEGDVVLARGSNGNVPFVPGVPIGEITNINSTTGSVTQIASVKFFVNFSSLGVVSVVVSPPKSDPRDALVPEQSRPTPIPTVTVYANPSENSMPSPSATPTPSKSAKN